VLANINFANMFALVGAIFFVATLLTQTMVPLRIANNDRLCLLRRLWRARPRRQDVSLVSPVAAHECRSSPSNAHSEELVDRDDGDFDFVGVLNHSAVVASHKICRELFNIDQADPNQVAAVWNPGRMVRDFVDINDVDPMMTDEQLEQLPREYLAAAEEEGIHVDGSLTDELITMRDNMREDQDEARL
jgi:hypothetical protein